MKKLKKLLSLLLGGILAFSSFATLIGCKQPDGDGGDGGQLYNPETRPLMLAIGALDQNFNPFFATSLYDSEIAGQTQVSLISADENGEVAVGDNYPSVALDYKVTMYDTKQVGTGNVTDTGSNDGRTEYEFLIKNGMKFSDGQTLDINDVLFNLYVYLDPAYTGSATIYSTDIQGLDAYRAQDPDLADGSSLDYESGFYAEASARVSAIVEWSSESGTPAFDNIEDAQLKADITTVKELFAKEASTDWNSVATSWRETYKDKYTFTEAWQAYLFSEGVVTVQLVDNEVTGGKTEAEINGKYVTTLDAPINNPTDEAQDAHIAQAIATASSDDKVAQYLAQNPNATAEYAKEELQRQEAVQIVVDYYTEKSKLWEVVSYWATASEVMELFAGEARTEYYDSKKDSGDGVDNISGVTHYSTTTFKGVELGASHDVLKIVINGIDPKAIWNFGFSVCPMHYYSDSATTALADNELAQVRAGSLNVANRKNFGVKIGNSDFFNNVLKSTTKNGLPVGAGAYMASSVSGGTVTRHTFFENNVVYFERNPYFYTMGENIENAKIKYMRYKVMSDDNIILALKQKEIDYGEPNASRENVTIISQNASFLNQHTYYTAGYGYVGINPKYVEEVQIRQAIMKAMDTASIIGNYYGRDLAMTIYRPMSYTSWAYPKTATEYESIAFTTELTEIIDLVESAGYFDDNNDGIREKGNKKLEYTFTIAGESDDHPAYQMFMDAAEILNSIGFKISVKPDIQALKKMNSGQLAVWAAAWSSGVDPDMYQVYHKDSKATSVNNWNYAGILENKDGKFDYELDIVNRLSDKIDEARTYLLDSQRAPIYAECLDLVMDLAVELPTYQRCDLCAYNKTVIDSRTVNSTPNHNMGVISRIWEVNYV